MNRLFALSLVASAVALSPARAQEAPTDTTALPAAADTVATDSAAVIQPDPEQARDLYDEGRTLLRSQDFEGALGKFDQALLYHDAYAVAALGRAQALAQLRRLEDSRNAFESAIAMAEASDASNADEVRTTAQRGLEQVTAVIDARTQAQAQAQAASAEQDRNAKIQQAIDLLQANPLEEADAMEAYALLEQARNAGYDPNQAAFYYAKALNAMDRGADAVPFAQTALEASAGQGDRSPYYIQLGLAHMGAGNTAEARAAFEAVNEGDSWHGWAQHYIGQLETEG